MRLFILLLCSLCLLVQAKPVIQETAVGQHIPAADWRTLETPHFMIHFPQAHQAQAQHLAKLAEQRHPDLSATFNWAPRDKTVIVISDDYDSANGWATPLPFNAIRMFMFAPDDINQLESFTDWQALLFEHEYTHILHLDKAAGAPNTLRSFFGRGAGVLQLGLFPNAFQPLFMIEGLAIRQESALAAQSGRLHNSYYKMLIRDEVERGPMSLSEVSLSGSYSYLYGAYFYQFLVQEYGADAVAKLIATYSTNLIPFTLSNSFQQVFGKTDQQLWRAFQHWLQTHYYQAESPLAAKYVDSAASELAFYTHLEQGPVRQGEWIWRLWHNGKQSPELRAYDQQHQLKQQIKVRSTGQFDVNEQGDIIISQTRYRADNRYLADLYLYSKGRWQQLTDKQRFTEAYWWQDKQIIAKRQLAGRSELVLLDPAGKLLQTLWQAPQGVLLGRFSVHPASGQLVAALHKADSGWQLYQFQFAEQNWQALTFGPGIKQQPAFSPDGSNILFVADIEGSYNIFRLMLADKDLSISQLTFSRRGIFNPVQANNGDIWFEYYHDRTRHLMSMPDAAGQQLAIAPAEAYQNAESAAAVISKHPDTIYAVQSYSPWQSLAPTGWLPSWQLDNETTQLAFLTEGADALGRHQYSIMAGIDQQARNVFGELSYHYANRYSLSLSREIAHQRASLEAINSIATDKVSFYRWNTLSALADDAQLHLGFVSERLHSIRDTTNSANFADYTSQIVGAIISYDTVRQYFYNVVPSSGRRLNISAEQHIGNSDFQGQSYKLRWLEHWVFMQNHVLRLQLDWYQASQNGKPLRLGGEQSAQQNLLEVDRYHLRGYAEQQLLQGRELSRLSAEWRFPLARVERNWRTFPVGLYRIHGGLFIEHGMIKNSEQLANKTQLTGLGAELVLEPVLAYQMQLPLTFGFARGTDSRFGENRVYIKLGSVF